MITVTLYSRQDCHLCDQAKEDLDSLRSQIPHELVVVDVDQDPKFQRKYGEQVPVVEVGPYSLKAPFDRTELQITLGAVQRGLEHNEEIDRFYAGSNVAPWTWADSFSYWLSKHYLALLNMIVIIYLGLPVLAPALMKAGAAGPASLIYKVYGAACHQYAFRSMFLFGEQLYYPRAAAGIDGLITYEQATGFPSEDILTARNFTGNDVMGYKVGLCERDVSIYGGILIFGFIMLALRLMGLLRFIKPLPWYLWILIGLVPIGLDGFSQLISQLPFGLLPYRESTPFLRILTGGLFGFTTAWFGYPMVEETMADTRRFMEAKLKRLNGIKAGT
ncbi:MAG: DUF2085 domain-containing protein [Chloroflexota bacterium]|nr:MAG: DUF2085 domain-containing protein [Chloroflexota bacterium]